MVVDGLGDAVDDVCVSPIGAGQTRATYRIVVPTLAPVAANPRDVRRQAAVPGRRGAGPASFGYQAEHAFYTEVADFPFGSRCHALPLRPDSAEQISSCCSRHGAPPSRVIRSLAAALQKPNLAVRALAIFTVPHGTQPGSTLFAAPRWASLARTRPGTRRHLHHGPSA